MQLQAPILSQFLEIILKLLYKMRHDRRSFLLNKWGDQLWDTMEDAFKGCTNLATINAPDWPKFATTGDFISMFEGCSSLNADLDHWDTSNVTHMDNTFRDATVFNGALNNWDTSSVQEFTSMFRSASAFNQPIGNWDTSSATQFGYMFRDAVQSNQDIGTWNVSNARIMWHMLEGSTAFDQDLGNWNVEEVNSMFAIFLNAELSVDNYDALLIGWDAQNLMQNISFDAGSSKYCLGAAARANIDNNDN